MLEHPKKVLFTFEQVSLRT